MQSMTTVRVGEIRYMATVPVAAPRMALRPSPRFSERD